MNKSFTFPPIQTGRVFSEGAYTDEGRWIRAEEYERVKSELDAIRKAQWSCRICGGLVDLRGAVRPEVHVGPGRPQQARTGDSHA